MPRGVDGLSLPARQHKGTLIKQLQKVSVGPCCGCNQSIHFRSAPALSPRSSFTREPVADSLASDSFGVHASEGRTHPPVHSSTCESPLCCLDIVLPLPIHKPHKSCAQLSLQHVRVFPSSWPISKRTDLRQVDQHRSWYSMASPLLYGGFKHVKTLLRAAKDSIENTACP